MAPKSAPAAATATAPSKARKSSSAKGEQPTEQPVEQTALAAPPRSERWAVVSGSANSDDEPRLVLQDPDDLKQYGILRDSKQESIGPKEDKKHWSPHTFVKQVAAYAHKYNIELRGPEAIAEPIEGAEDGGLPEDSANSTAAADPFFAKALKSYKARYSNICQNMSPSGKAGMTAIGGDSLDVTTWTSAERTKYAYRKKDPLGKAGQDAIKQGTIFQMVRR
ncbi:hypothetical protein B0H67DRAFT_556433 [Lasiosphaeris hirsuta]|uniref:Uncharacterized protein n=1 Tax=Lasiosphaeris hirsuta TaxID=260670 RepID=A0AA40A1Y1_9PEZI|nr:hypothetical protein B0H67DRAFT_556433 [Lasiosphaeris hirsuta]